MSSRLIAAAVAGAFLLPAAAHAQSRVAVPSVELFATVTGKWVLNPRACRDIREDVRDARRTESRRDRREDRRDQRVADCPASAYTFVPDAGQGPKFPVRVGRGRVPREYRGRPMFINGDTIGRDGRPVETRGQAYAPAPQPQFQRAAPAPQPQYQAPQPTFQTPPPVYSQPTVQQYQPQQAAPQYQQPTVQQYQPQPVPQYQQPAAQQQPTYQQAPSTVQQPTYQPAAPAQPTSNYRIDERGFIIFE